MAILAIIILICVTVALYLLFYLLLVVSAGLISWYIDIIKESKERDSE